MTISRTAGIAALAYLLAVLPARPAPALGAADATDAAEEITPEELATIPEPVPPISRVPDPQGASNSESASQALSGASGEALWRVQVFATQSQDLAGRIALEAGRLLEAKAYVALEGSRYKVRLGDYGSEGEAAELRSRAVRSGYPGAFRIRCAPNPSIKKD